MIRRILILLVVVLLTPIAHAADATETRVVRYLGRDRTTHDLFVADALTRERLNVPTDPNLRAKQLARRSDGTQLLKITISGEGSNRKITDLVPYSVPDVEQQADTYVFQSADIETNGGKKTVRVKLTRYEVPTEATFVLGSDTEWMQTRIGKLRSGTPVLVGMKRVGKTVILTDIDIAAPVVRGLFIKDTDVKVDGKKIPAAIFDVNGEEKTYLLPPAGQKLLPGDSDVQSFVRKLKRGQAACLSFDSDRPDVIRKIDPDLLLIPYWHSGIQVIGSGVKITADVDLMRANVFVRVEPSPVSNADLDLAVGLRKLAYGSFDPMQPPAPVPAPGAAPVPDPGPNVPMRELSEIMRLINSFPRDDEVRNDARQLEQHIRQYVALNAAKNNADARKIEAALVEATIQLGIKYGPGVSDSYRQARVLLKDQAEKVESMGKLSRAAGDFVR